MKVPDVKIEDKDIKKALEFPDGLSLDLDHPVSLDPEHWSVGPMILTRDSGLMAQSNRDALISHLQKKYKKLKKDWELTTANHWGRGWVEHLSFRVLNEDKTVSDIFKVLTDWYDGLAEYPVADESDYLKRQWEATIRNIADEGNIDEELAERVYRWLIDNDPRSVEDEGDTGAYPSQERILRALKSMKAEKFEDVE